MPSFAPMVYIERAVLDPMGRRLFANTPTTEEPSTAQVALTEQAVLALTALRSCADHIRYTRNDREWIDAAEYLANHTHVASVWIVPCLEGATPTRTSGSSIYPSVQNMLLAARALGLGATLTTLYLQFEKETEAALGLPPGVHSYALLPIGYPMGGFGPVRRVPLSDVVYADRWGQPYRD
jgi:nitroreductase